MSCFVGNYLLKLSKTHHKAFKPMSWIIGQGQALIRTDIMKSLRENHSFFCKILYLTEDRSCALQMKSEVSPT